MEWRRVVEAAAGYQDAESGIAGSTGLASRGRLTSRTSTGTPICKFSFGDLGFALGIMSKTQVEKQT